MRASVAYGPSNLAHCMAVTLLYLSLSTGAVIGQFNGPFLLYGPLKFKAVFVAKMFRDLSPSALNFYSKRGQ